MAIKALKQNVSIREIQKMIHQWKNRGINDPTVTKLLDLHLGMPAYMNESGIYPLCNFYYTSNPQLSSSASFLRLNVLSSLN